MLNANNIMNQSFFLFYNFFLGAGCFVLFVFFRCLNRLVGGRLGLSLSNHLAK